MASAGDGFGPSRAAVLAALSACGPALVAALADGVAALAPPGSLPLLGAALYHTLRAGGPSAPGWLAAAVLNPGHPQAAAARAARQAGAGPGAEAAAEAAAAAAGSPVSEADKRAFLEAALRPPPHALPQRRFEALVADYGALCRRLESPDCLLAYAA